MRNSRPYPVGQDHLGFDLSSLIGGSSTADAGINALAQVVATNPTFLQNRARLAAVSQMAYNGMAVYTQWQPFLFLLGISGLVTSGYMLYQRRSRGAETVALWTVASLTAAGLSYFTRPAFLRPAPTVDPATTSSPVMAEILGYLDNQVATYTAESPGWEGTVLEQVAADFGGGTIDPAVATLLTENAH